MHPIIRLNRKLRETRMFVRAMQSASHPILAQIVPIRRCNLDCAYCNEYDKTSAPVPVQTMLRRIDRLADLGTTIITLSGGEPTLHPDLDAIIRRIRDRGAIATLITNGLLLTPDRIRALNRAGLDYLQISIDNVAPDDISKKSLRVLDRKLSWLAQYAEFSVTINSVLGAGVRNAVDAVTVGRRARELGFTSTVGVLHDRDGQLQPLAPDQRNAYDRFRHLKTGLFSFAHFDHFQENVAQGVPNDWHCGAGGRFLYVCEDGLFTTALNGAASQAFRSMNTLWTTSGGKLRARNAARPSVQYLVSIRPRCSTSFASTHGTRSTESLPVAAQSTPIFVHRLLSACYRGFFSARGGADSLGS